MAAAAALALASPAGAVRGLPGPLSRGQILRTALREATPYGDTHPTGIEAAYGFSPDRAHLRVYYIRMHGHFRYSGPLIEAPPPASKTAVPSGIVLQFALETSPVWATAIDLTVGDRASAPCCRPIPWTRLSLAELSATIDGHAYLIGGPLVEGGPSPDKNLWIRLEEEGRVVAQWSSGENGTFQFRVIPGHYTVVADYTFAPGPVCEAQPVSARRGSTALVTFSCQAAL